MARLELVVCDGCGEQRTAVPYPEPVPMLFIDQITLPEKPEGDGRWLRGLHFCDWRCLAAWAGEQDVAEIEGDVTDG